MKNFRNQQGVALLFALGMLTILLVTGMAFVANALTAQKVAANNSARTQARMFAQSAISRVLASIMLYQQRIFKASGNSAFPEKFDYVYSYEEVAGETEPKTYKDGLSTDGSQKSLLYLPNSIVAENVAKEFNKKLEGEWKGSWVFFYDKASNDTDKEIIGRAAWQVLSNAPQILAPVFWSGHLDTDGTDDWTPNDHRWGREIDEVFFADNSIFSAVKNQVKDTDQVKNLESWYPKLGIADTNVQQWLESWLMPDVRGANVLEPVPVIPEVYSAIVSGRKRQYLRFNISEILKENLSKYGEGISETSDPWYARFGINSTPTSIAGNDAKALDLLTANSPEAAMGDSFDYKLKADPNNIENHERPSLPFLRRIGNSDSDKDNPTFKNSDGSVNVEAWRKQIAANFNDYCDADNIPTSDVPAKDWANAMGEGYKHPVFTGNEKTPYLYELGFRMGFFKAKEDNTDLVDVSKPGIDSDKVSVGSEGNCSVNLNAFVGLAPIVKLANIYDFNSTNYSNFSAGVDLGELEVKLIPNKVTLEVEFSNQDTTSGNTKFSNFVKGSDYNMAFTEITVKVADKNFTTQIASFAANDPGPNNVGGEHPYPLMIPNELAETETAKLTGSCSFKITKDIVKNAGGSIPNDASIDKVSIVSIDEFKVTSVKLNVKRAYLAATYDSKTFGLDYVRPLGEIASTLDADTGVTVKIEENKEDIPGIYLGGIRNYDPRQNLNPDDWYRKLILTAAKNIKDPAATDSELGNVMYLAEVNSPNAGDTTGEEANKFNPAYADEFHQDIETVTKPGYDNVGRLSTAFIRNAPMMSPWEIGLIHRGVRWQTLNIKNACDPETNGSSIKLTSYAPIGENKWDASGTSYAGGDGAILDQIKMTDQCSTYGKININKLGQNDNDAEIVRALFDNLRYRQSMDNFYKNSTRKANED